MTTWEYMQFFPPRGIKELAVCIAHTTCPYLTLCASPLPSFGRDYCDVLIYKLLFPDLQLWCQFTIGNSTTLVAKVVLYEMFLQRWRLLTWARAWQMSQRLLSVMSGKVELLFLMLLRSWFLQSRLMCKNQLSVWECVGVPPRWATAQCILPVRFRGLWVLIKCKQRCSHHQPFARVGKGESLFVQRSAMNCWTCQC